MNTLTLPQEKERLFENTMLAFVGNFFYKDPKEVIQNLSEIVTLQRKTKYKQDMPNPYTKRIDDDTLEKIADTKGNAAFENAMNALNKEKLNILVARGEINTENFKILQDKAAAKKISDLVVFTEDVMAITESHYNELNVDDVIEDIKACPSYKKTFSF